MTHETDHHSRLYELALERGIISQSDADFVAESEALRRIWGSRLALLLATGRLNERDLGQLEDSIEDDETPVPTETETIPLGVQFSGKSMDSPGSLFASLGRSFDPAGIDAFKDLTQYEVQSYLGEGGMGRVFKAWDPRLKRDVALKFLRKDDPDAMDRFVREAQAQAKVKHPGVCRVYEAGEVSGYPYIAMQYIDGVPLKDVMHELNLKEKVRITRDVAEAVHAAHRTGLIHRDLKPGNIMLERSEDGSWIPFVMDFGLAREMEGPSMTATGLAIGTPAYMAPEQARGDSLDLDRRTDVYALGGMLFHMLTGRVVFEAGSSFDVIMKVLTAEPRRPRSFDPAIPLDLDTIVMKCLEKEPRARYESARALQRDLQRYLDDEPIQARPISAFERLRKKARKNKAMTAVIAAATITTFVLSALWVHARWTAAKQAEFAQEFGQRIQRQESVLWRTYSLPRHDTSNVKGEIRGQLEQMERALPELGSAAQGPGWSSLGRGFLAIGDLNRAREALEKAWNGGYRTPITAYTLGCTLGEMYHLERAALSRVQDAQERREREAQLKREYRAPAHDFLKLAAGVDLETPLYLEALLAATDGEHEMAVTLAQEAFDQVPHLYQAKLIEGRSHGDIARQRHRANDRDGAAQANAAAFAAFDAAQTIAPSDPRVYLYESRVCRRQLDVEHRQGYIQEDTYNNLIEACTRALEADSKSLEATIHACDAHTTWADHIARQGQDAVPTIIKGIEMAHQAVHLAPDSSESHSIYALALLNRGKIEMLQRRDPQAWFEKAAEEAEKVVELRPDQSDGYNRLGLIYLEIGNYETNSLRDGRDALDKSRRNFIKAAELREYDFATHANLGMVHFTRAENALYLGEDPVVDLEEAVTYFQKAKSMMPDTVRIESLIGACHLLHAKYRYQDGEDPTSQLSSAKASFEPVLQKHPDHAESLFWRASVHEIRAEYRATQDQSPMQAIDQSRRDYRRVVELNPNYPWADDGLGNVAYLEAQWLLDQGKNPESALREAETWYTSAMEKFNTPEDYHLSFCHIELIRARWLMSRNRKAIAALDRASKHVTAAMTSGDQTDYLKLTAIELDFLKQKARGYSPEETKSLLDRLSGIEPSSFYDRQLMEKLEDEIETRRENAATANWK